MPTARERSESLRTLWTEASPSARTQPLAAEVRLRLAALEEAVVIQADSGEEALAGAIDLAIDEAEDVIRAVIGGGDPFGDDDGTLRLRALEVPGRTGPIPCAVLTPPGFRQRQQWPAFVYLHGGLNDVNLSRYAVERAADAMRRRQQAPNGSFATTEAVKIWLPRQGDHWPENPNRETLFTALRFLQEQYRAEEDRIYLQGFSMGGFATMYYATRFPDRFAGAGPSGVPNSGAHLPFLDNLANLPVYLCHGARDDTCDVVHARAIYRGLLERQCDCAYLEEARLSHGTGAEARAGQEYWLLGKSRVREPRRVRYTTDDPSCHTAYWVDLRELSPEVRPLTADMPADWTEPAPPIVSLRATSASIHRRLALRALPGAIAQVDAAVREPGRLEVHTRHIRTLSLNPPGGFLDAGKACLRIDGQDLSDLAFGEEGLLLVQSGSGTWSART